MNNLACTGSYQPPERLIELPSRTVYSRGLCAVCGREWHLRVDGTVRLHRRRP